MGEEGEGDRRYESSGFHTSPFIQIRSSTPPPPRLGDGGYSPTRAEMGEDIISTLSCCAPPPGLRYGADILR